MYFDDLEYLSPLISDLWDAHSDEEQASIKFWSSVHGNFMLAMCAILIICSILCIANISQNKPKFHVMDISH